ncbi:MAG: hypothetical protein V7607_2494, partial [Solirubrobacteraceae bacterium]
LAPNVLTHPGPPVFVDPWQDPQASGAARTTLLRRSQPPWARQLAPESADAIASVLRAAYDQLAERDEAPTPPPARAGEAA